MAQQTITRADVGLRSERGPILGSVMLSVALVALDSTILATAVPSIVDDLGGFAQFPWLFSIFLLAQAVSVPIFAKLSDQFGRKPIMLIGVGAFVLGSILCGLAWSMPALIAFRAVQGLGAGAVQPMAMTIIGDIYSVAERAKVQGYVASVWAMSSVVGPTLGGLFVDFADWRWIFFVNVPLGAVAAWALVRRFHEQVDRTRPKLDLAGAGLLTAGSSLLILGLLQGGVSWPWSSAPSLALLGSAGALLVGFALVERRAAEPVLPGWVFRSRLLNATNLVALAVGVMLIGLVSYIPLYAQGVLGTSALVAGFAVAALTLGWPLAASVAGRIYLRIGFRATALIGAAVLVGRRGDAGPDLTGQPGLAARRHLLRGRPRPGPVRQPHPDRGPVGRRLGRTGGGHRHQRVRPLDGQRTGHRGLRRHRQRLAGRPGSAATPAPRRASRRRPWTPPSIRSSSRRPWSPPCCWPRSP